MAHTDFLSVFSMAEGIINTKVLAASLLTVTAIRGFGYPLHHCSKCFIAVNANNFFWTPPHFSSKTVPKFFQDESKTTIATNIRRSAEIRGIDTLPLVLISAHQPPIFPHILRLCGETRLKRIAFYE